MSKPKRITLRIPHRLAAHIDAIRRAERRTLNAQIVMLLERSLPPKAEAGK